MKVLKFGGTSVGTPESLRNVKDIIESRGDEKLIVVVSALGGITDKLIAAARTASKGDLKYIVDYAEIVSRHLSMIDAMVPQAHYVGLRREINALLEELGNIYRGISLIKDLSERTLDVVVSYGERMSSAIISKVIEGAVLVDSRDMIITRRSLGKHVLDVETTDRKIHERIDQLEYRVAIVPGFISSDISGDVTNLGRGGSDYTAAILAGALGAEILEIWTDVDGFMTADPRLVPSAEVIDRLSFGEAMDLCNCGAKVIYPPTIYPVFRRDIPIVVKNTFNSSAPGSLISGHTSPASDMPVKGLSSVKAISLVSLSGSGVETVADFAPRIFDALSRRGITPQLVSLVFNRNSVLVAVGEADAADAVESLTDRFMTELQDGRLSEISATSGYSTVAIVGDNMRQAPGIVGRLSLVLEQASIAVAASTQGATENKTIFVVRSEDMVNALLAIHSAMFR